MGGGLGRKYALRIRNIAVRKGGWAFIADNYGGGGGGVKDAKKLIT